MKRKWLIALMVLLVLAGCGAPRDVTLPTPNPTAVAATAVGVAEGATATALTELVRFEWSTSGGMSAFAGPSNVDVGPDGSIYVVDGGHNRIVRFDQSGEAVCAWGATGKQPGQFMFVEGSYGDVAVDREGNVYVTDSGNRRVQKFDADGHFLLQWEVRGSAGPPVRPFGIALDPAGNCFISDNTGYRVLKFDSEGNFLLEWGKRGIGPGQFNQDLGLVATDSQGHVYVSDRGNGRVQVFDNQGQYLREITTCAGPQDKLEYPAGVAIDGQDCLYIGVIEQGRICKYDSNGQYLFSWGSSGDGPEQFHHLLGIAVDARNNVYAISGLGNSLKKFSQP